jgi:CBS domain-containing protein
MAAMFAGASRALLASVVFAFETTRQPMGLLPLLGGCSAAFLVSCLLMRHSIMTEKIARRGVRIADEWTIDILDRISVRDCASKNVVTLRIDRQIAAVREELNGHGHQGYPVVDRDDALVGVVTLKDLRRGAPSQTLASLITAAPQITHEDCSLREAVTMMAERGIGRLPVVDRENPRRLVGILTRSDVLAAYRRQIDESRRD